eukprot:Tamp_14505.p1 GENE.Tamp_14505~~Tamp_14505.p1  ORF type:complete len:328 (-),score=-26.63 Tamp_14505:7-990(-)
MIERSLLLSGQPVDVARPGAVVHALSTTLFQVSPGSWQPDRSCPPMAKHVPVFNPSLSSRSPALPDNNLNSSAGSPFKVARGGLQLCRTAADAGAAASLNAHESHHSSTPRASRARQHARRTVKRSRMPGVPGTDFNGAARRPTWHSTAKRERVRFSRSVLRGGPVSGTTDPGAPPVPATSCTAPSLRCSFQSRSPKKNCVLRIRSATRCDVYRCAAGGGRSDSRRSPGRRKQPPPAPAPVSPSRAPPPGPEARAGACRRNLRPTAIRTFVPEPHRGWRSHSRRQMVVRRSKARAACRRSRQTSTTSCQTCQKHRSSTPLQRSLQTP